TTPGARPIEGEDTYLAVRPPVEDRGRYSHSFLDGKNHSDHDNSSPLFRQRLSHDAGRLARGIFVRTQVDNQGLIVPKIHLRLKVGLHAPPVDLLQHAEEDGILPRLSISLHHLVDAAQSLRIADVVAHQVASAHAFLPSVIVSLGTSGMEPRRGARPRSS